MRKIPFGAVLIAAIAAVVAASGIASGAPVQGFVIDARICIGGGPATTPALTCPGSEDLTLGGTPTVSTGVKLERGNRLTLVFTWTGPGWKVADDDLYEAAFPGQAAWGGSEVQVGDIKSNIDLLCDGVEDQFADNAGGYDVPEQIYWRGIDTPAEPSPDYLTTTSGPGDIINAGPATSKGHSDETYLEAILPASGYQAIARSRADVSRIYLFVPTTSPLSLGNSVPINFVTMHPTYAPAGSHVAVTLLAGAASAPSHQLLCLQAPQNSVSNIFGVVGAVNPVGNPASPDVAGVYTRWITALSAADIVDNTQEYVIISDHRVIGGGTHTDADGDGLELCSTAAAGRPCDTTEAAPGGTCGAGTALGAVSIPANDQDCDGLQDGIETSMGTCPNGTFKFADYATLTPVTTDCTTVPDPTDTDGDGRTDLEEVLGPANSLTDPKSTDTDGDGDGDGGLVIKAATGVHTGDTFRVSIPKDSTDNGGVKIFEGDNCPNRANADQLNSDSGRPNAPTSLVDRTNPTEDAFGDLCDGDDDNDFYTDLVESPNPGGQRCDINIPALVTPSADTAILDRDSDGDFVTGDGALDGRECQNNTDPTVNTSFPAIPQTGESNPDVDGLPYAPASTGVTAGFQDWEGFMFTVNIANGPATVTSDTDGDAKLGNADDDSDGDKVKDGDETFYWGTSPASADSDRDGCSDTVEVFSVDADGLPSPAAGVDFDDFGIFAAAYGKSRGTAGYSVNVNFNHKGTSAQTINFDDFGTFAAAYGIKCAVGSTAQEP